MKNTEQSLKNKKILIIAATHGDEPIGVQILKILREQKMSIYFDFLIANPKALAEKKIFIDANLNRSYPGKEDSDKYEERLAFKNLKIAKQYDYIIDIHEANEGKDDFIIIPREKLSNRFPIEFIDLKKVLLWPDPKGPISQVLENSIELEFGSKERNREEMAEKAVDIIINFIHQIYGISVKTINPEKEIYYVYGKLERQDFKGKIDELIDFSEYQNKNEKFLPLLSRQYLCLGVVCYKMKKIN